MRRMRRFSVTSWRRMIVFAWLKKHGPAGQVRMGRALGVDHTTLWHALRSLQEQGLVVVVEGKLYSVIATPRERLISRVAGELERQGVEADAASIADVVMEAA